MKILFLSHHWTTNSHHSRHSGFQRIVAFAAKHHDVTVVTWGLQDQEFGEGSVRVITVKGPRRDFFFLRRIAISKKGSQISGQFDAVHALYSDCTFSLAPGSYTVTFHVLPSVVKYRSIRQRAFLFLKYLVLQKRALRRAKHIGVVSRNLLEAIPQKFKSKASFIPHGVDTEFWDPSLGAAPDSVALKDFVLCVGSHGLDRDLLTALVHANPSRQFVFVGLKQRLGEFANTHYLYQLPDAELRNLYASAIFMIRPLLFATANNSILESLSMGKTLLVNRSKGVTDYLGEETCIFMDTLQAGYSLENLERRLLDPGTLRRHAIDTFGWNKILDTYIMLYQDKNVQHE